MGTAPSVTADCRPAPASISFHTLGCRLNQADTALIAADFLAKGLQVLPWGAAADIIVINTCAVTGIASRKSRQAAGSARREHPNSYIVVTGCDATAEGERLLQDGLADFVIMNPKPAGIADLILESMQNQLDGAGRLYRPAPLEEGFTVNYPCGAFLDHSRANIKIQEGCNFHCTYCIVPQTRGPARSRNFQDILRETRGLLEAGFKEIVITGVNIATYHDSGNDLPELLEAMLGLAPDFRIRLGSTEPGGSMFPHLVSLMAREPRICRFLHLPVQYGESSILRRMGRHYTAEEFRDNALDALQRIPGLCLGTDVIVGFPGETDETFAHCRDFIDGIGFGLMHVFTYSPRSGTPAATWPGRPSAGVSKERSNQLLRLAASKATAFARSQTGAVLSVLVETSDGDMPHGWSDNYLKVRISDCPDIPQNTIVEAVIDSYTGNREVVAHLKRD